MALQLVPPPPQVWSTYEESLVDFWGPHPPADRVVHLPVGALGLEDLLNGATPADALGSGCRFIARWSDGSLISCEMTNPTLYGQAAFRNFVSGEPVEVPFARIGEAEQLNAVKACDYELRWLSVPGIYLDALHLVCLGQGADLILPVGSPYPDLPVDAVLEAGEFVARARAIASARAALDTGSDLSS